MKVTEHDLLHTILQVNHNGGAMHSGKKWRSALSLNAMHSGKK